MPTTPWSTHHRHARPPPEPRLRRLRVGVPEPPAGPKGGTPVDGHLDPPRQRPPPRRGCSGRPRTRSRTRATPSRPTHTPSLGEQRRDRPRPATTGTTRSPRSPGARPRGRARGSVHGNSWTDNRRPDATNLHWLIGNFHDHLENTPQIAFDNAAGNFEDADRVVAQNVDGANTEAAASRTKTTSTTRT